MDSHVDKDVAIDMAVVIPSAVISRSEYRYR